MRSVTMPGAGLLVVSALVAAAADRKPAVRYVPTPEEGMDRMLEVARISSKDVVYDLGCGDGRIVCAAARRHRCKAVGFDIDRERVEESLANARKNGLERLVTIKQADVFTLDLSGASVITLYLGPELNARLLPQLEGLKPGSRVVSHAFALRGVEPARVVRHRSEENGCEHTLYLWVTPFRKEKP